MSAEASPSPAPVFELSGGALCLDFANTWGDRGRTESDQLTVFDDLLAFARQTATVDPQRVTELATRAERDPAAAEVALAAGRALRDGVYELFAARARGRAVPPHALATVNAALGAALAHLRLEPRDDGFVWAFTDSSELTALLWPIARSAGELLASPELARVRQCDGARCTWLFLDQSRGRSRRWCSMASCGNRAKARRHYRRQA